jgi:hypothetical protein
MKNKLILRPNEFTSFTSYYLEELWGRYFDIQVYNADKTYDRSGTVFAVWWMNADDEYSKRLRDQGHKVIVDNLWEVATKRTNYYWLENAGWEWYNESLWWRSMGYHKYGPNKKYSKLAFMPIRRRSTIRDQIVGALGSRVDNFLWSYHNKVLPNDAPLSEGNYQRFFNPQWYDDTYFSVVIETSQHGECYWPTDKIFKPIAYYHPFLAIAQPGLLKLCKKMGFETYQNIFDESYDNMLDFDSRLVAVIKNIDNFKKEPYDLETQRRLQHNHDHFFNQALVESRIITEIIEPLLAYAESRL